MTHPNKTTYHPSKINREQKENKNGHQSSVLWFTRLSGSGKSTLAHAVEEKLQLI
jgi:adenylylsulfate kinase|tara:strand:- start:427 stop:591 length:165 start_codon:yes stop_codon:yes gene_type:complete